MRFVLCGVTFYRCFLAKELKSKYENIPDEEKTPQHTQQLGFEVEGFWLCMNSMSCISGAADPSQLANLPNNFGDLGKSHSAGQGWSRRSRHLWTPWTRSLRLSTISTQPGLLRDTLRRTQATFRHIPNRSNDSFTPMTSYNFNQAKPFGNRPFLDWSPTDLTAIALG